MSSYYSSNLRILVAKIEKAPGTAVSKFDNEDFNVRIIDPVVTPMIETDNEASKYATGDHGEDESIMGAQSATIEFSVKMSSCPGDNVSKPAWWKFAEACGCKVKKYEAKDASPAGYALQPKKSEDVSTMTIRVYDFPRGSKTPAACYTFAGCMGNMTMGAEGVGKPWTAAFSFTGKLVSIDEPEDNFVPELLITDKTIAEKMLNYDLSFDGIGEADKSVSQKISSFLLDIGNEISPLIDQADPTGYAYYAVTKRSPRLSCDPLLNGKFADMYGSWKNEKTFSVTLSPVSASANGTAGFTLYLPKAQALTAAIVSREGLVNWELNLKALRNNGAEKIRDQEVTWELLVGKKSIEVETEEDN
ncbi:MAG: hypothetical protein LBI42_12450 [Chitinispirillales bacterium]|jgi:hypothetical protein|nr:hypothetical protein [Chitinispirillales bacterium]